MCRSRRQSGARGGGWSVLLLSQQSTTPLFLSVSPHKCEDLNVEVNEFFLYKYIRYIHYSVYSLQYLNDGGDSRKSKYVECHCLNLQLK